MNARIKHTYLQFKLKDFIELMPDVASTIDEALHISLSEFAKDEDYYIRLASDGRVEFGYLSDDWTIS